MRRAGLPLGGGGAAAAMCAFTAAAPSGAGRVRRPRKQDVADLGSDGAVRGWPGGARGPATGLRGNTHVLIWVFHKQVYTVVLVLVCWKSDVTSETIQQEG